MFSIDYQSREPIYEQLYNNVIMLMSLGVLEAGQQLPPVRQLASQLGVNPNTVSKAYKNLEKDGIIYSVVGKGSFITPDTNAADGQKREALKVLGEKIKAALKIGIPKEEIVNLIDEIYNKE